MQKKTNHMPGGQPHGGEGGLGEENKAAHFLLRDSFFKEPSVQTGSQDATGRLGIWFYHFPGFLRVRLCKVEKGSGKSRAAGKDRPKRQNAQPGEAQGRSVANEAATTDVVPKRKKKGSGPKWGTGDGKTGTAV